MLLFNEPILYGQFIRRYQRFFMDIRLDDGEIVTAHTPNTGSMLGLLNVDGRVMLSKSQNKKRSCAYTAEAIKIDGSFVGINTMAPNRLIKASLSHPLLDELKHYQTMKAEKAYGLTLRSRVDFYFSNSSEGHPPLYLEIKNVTLKLGDDAQFPDAVSERALKHVEDLISVVNDKNRASLWFIVQRQDCLGFKTAASIDKIYAKRLIEAHHAGVNVRALAAQIDEKGLVLTHEIPCFL